MPAAKARAAQPSARLIGCNSAPGQRKCLIVSANVYGAPAILYAMHDRAGARVEKIVAIFDPKRMRTPADRCVRLSETVFSHLVDRLGPYYTKRSSASGRDAPAVAWRSESIGYLVYEARCGTPNDGSIQITLSAFPAQSRQQHVRSPARAPQARKRMRESKPRAAPRVPVAVSVLPLPPTLRNTRPQQPPASVSVAGTRRGGSNVAISADRRPKSKADKAGSWLLWMPIERDALYRSLMGNPGRPAP